MRRVQHLALQRVDVRRIPPQQQRRQDGVECRLGGGDCGVAESLAPADEAIRRFDLHQQDFEPAPWLPGEKWMRAAHSERQGYDGRLDRHDLRWLHYGWSVYLWVSLARRRQHLQGPSCISGCIDPA